MSDPVELVCLELPCDVHAPAIVRRALGDAGSDCQRLDDGVLVASELVTNAVLHSGCENGHSIQVYAGLVADGLLISVHDPGLTRQDAAPRRPAREEEPLPRSSDHAEGDPPSAVDGGAGGWGLRIVAQLARRWGAERPDGYRVWAELALPS